MNKETLDFVPPSAEKLQNFFGVFLQFQIGVDSNNACRGYVIKAMESCGYKSKDIREVLIELYEVFDFCSVEEAAAYYEHW